MLLVYLLLNKKEPKCVYSMSNFQEKYCYDENGCMDRLIFND